MNAFFPVPALAALTLAFLSSPVPPSAAGQETPPANATERTFDSHRVTIYRDTWGVPHIHGPTDGRVVFGGAYAQAEDNWPQVEENFVRAIGRSAELDGEAALLDDYLAHGLRVPEVDVNTTRTVALEVTPAIAGP